MIFHIAVCSPDSVLRSRVERQCLDYYARRDDACIIEQLDSPEALLARDDAGERYELYLIELPSTAAAASLRAAAAPPRPYQGDEREPLYATLFDKSSVFCQNYDSPYLLYPLTKPHGASQSGLLTFAPVNIAAANRVELPVEGGFMKLLDLDRCYSVSRIPAEDGKELVLYDLHLSAYTSDGTIATEQLKLLLADMQAEYDAGNWCVAGGDFNKDLLGDSSAYFGAADQEYSWAQPIPEGVFDGYDVQLIAPLDESDPVPSCRNADSAYHAGQYVLTVDGFMVTPNVTVSDSAVLDTGFAYSDHNPVKMTFTLN